jgi:hypothetical protein
MSTESLALTTHEPPKQERRGRRRKFLAGERRWLASLIRQYGIRETHRIAGVSISCNTLIKIGREFNIPMPHGRGGRRAA